MLKEKDLIDLIADTLRQTRREKKYTLEKLAEKSDTDYSTVSLIENGRQNPKVYTVYKLFYALDIDITELIAVKKNEMQDSKLAMLNRLEKLDSDTLEAVCELLDKFDISKKE